MTNRKSLYFHKPFREKATFKEVHFWNFNLCVIYSTFYGMDLRNMGNMTRAIHEFVNFFSNQQHFLHFFGKKDKYDISFFCAMYNILHVEHQLYKHKI